MSTYAIGDVQGCAKTFSTLLETLQFNPSKDRLWLAGDLVNRGPNSLSVLRYIYDNRAAIDIVLGNHDLHLLAVASGAVESRPDDTIDDILNASDKEKLLHWLRQQPLFHKKEGYAMVHAGLLPSWDLSTVQRLSAEIETILKSDSYAELFLNMKGNEPARWNDNLTSWSRYRFIINALTRMRSCITADEIDLTYKGLYENIPRNSHAWFDLPMKMSPEITLIFGHWSALGLYQKANVICLDSGCIWGGPLTAYCLETQQITQVANQDM